MNTRLIWVDALRITAAVAVVILHVTADLVMTRPDVRSPDWWISNAFEACVRWAVPVFIIISGGFILPRAAEAAVGVFYRKRLPRLAIPLVTWTVFYIVYSGLCSGFSSKKSIGGLLFGRPYYHLWFMFALVGLYLVAPYVARMMNTLSRRENWMMTIGLFIMLSAHETLSTLRGIASPFDAFSLWIPVLPYFLMGALLIENTGTGLANPKKSWAVGAVFAMMLIAVGTGVLLPSVGSPLSCDLMYRYLNPFVALSAVAMVHYFSGLRLGRTLTHVVSILSPVSLGVYLIHPLWLDVVKTLHLGADSNYFCSPAIGIPITTAIVLLLSYVSCLLIKVIPGGKTLVS